MSLGALMDGIGAVETRIVWGTYRNIPHAYREFVFGKDLSSIMWTTLCKRKLTPRGSVTKLLDEVPLGACFNCRCAIESGQHKSVADPRKDSERSE